MKDHPEVKVLNTLEPTVGEQLRLVEFNKKLDQANEAELREIAKLLAQQAIVSQPAVIRYLAREAAQNLSGIHNSEAESIMAALKKQLIKEE
jgi:ABC-type Zn uptake system ZnuABC Zn-binding protein ZnuA